jgi:hypothetical protein
MTKKSSKNYISFVISVLITVAMTKSFKSTMKATSLDSFDTDTVLTKLNVLPAALALEIKFIPDLYGLLSGAELIPFVNSKIRSESDPPVL